MNAESKEAESRIMGFTGVMSTGILKKKLQLLYETDYGERTDATANEYQRVWAILSKKTYSKMTVQEVAEKWNMSDRGGRYEMLSDIPKLWKERVRREIRDGNIGDILDRSWEELEFSDFDFRPYFEELCKK